MQPRPHRSRRSQTPAYAARALCAVAVIGVLTGCDPYRAGRAALLAGDPRAALRLLRPRNAEGHLLRARAYLAAGASQEAVVEAEAALAQGQRRDQAAETWAVLGRAELAVGRRARALAALSRAEDLVPGCCGARPVLAELLLERARTGALPGRVAAARRDAATALRLWPAARAQVEAAQAAITAAERAAGAGGAGTAAADHGVPGCQTAPEPAAAWCALGEHFLARAELWPAAVALTESVELGGGAAATGRARATLRALSEWWRALERPPAQARRDHAVVAWEELLGRAPMQRLVQAVRQEAEATPRARAQTLLERGDARGALQALATMTDPATACAASVDSDGVALLRARAQYLLGDHATALATLQDFADRPVLRACRYPGAIALLAELGEVREALPLARALVEEAPDSPAALLIAAQRELAVDDRPAAALDLEAYVFHSRDRATAFADAALNWRAAGRVREACAALGRALALRGGGHRSTLLSLGRCLLQDGQATAAADTLARYVALAPAGERDRARAEVAQLAGAADHGGVEASLLGWTQARVSRAPAGLTRVASPDGEPMLLARSLVGPPAARCAAHQALAQLYSQSGERRLALRALRHAGECGDLAARFAVYGLEAAIRQ